MSEQPKFTNRPNPKIYSQNGEVFYHSRADAVVAEICLYDIQQKTWSILLMQRGLKDQEFAGYWALPSGYLDWNETLYQAMMREVCEETGVWLPMVIQQSTSVLADQQPWRIADAPTGQKKIWLFIMLCCLHGRVQTIRPCRYNRKTHAKRQTPNGLIFNMLLT